MSVEKKRLFFALWPEKDTREQLVARTRTAVAASGGRPVSAANLHITLAFLHNVETNLLPCLTAAAGRAAGDAFDVMLTRLGHWYRSRILWLAPAPGETGAGRLAAALWNELADCGFTAERRRYHPHVTLARKVRNPPAPTELPAIRWHVRHFALVQSLTGRARSEYAVLETFPLSDAERISR